MVQLKDPIEAAVNATAQTFVIGFAGVVLAWLKVVPIQLFDKSGGESLGRLTMNLFLPMLMFTTLVNDIHTDDLGAFFLVLLFTTSTSHSVHVVLGISVGYAFAILLRSPPDVRSLISSCLGKGITQPSRTQPRFH
jgi:predicted permease